MALQGSCLEGLCHEEKGVFSMTRHALKLGYKASAEQFGPRQLLDFAVEAEACGFESVWISDHFQPWRHTNGHAPFAFSWLGAVGERTKHVLLGTSVLTP